ncbi:uncharacterized protein LOC130701464 [Daphnia carinata]|uniref:uncharacterized protein LOC130701464 n=1 Tax=Daphnia carinata TaxID=120202 RepID=UPI0025808399|nr:uncharacterized protein LOC130701464 [Daphnia carinata]
MSHQLSALSEEQSTVVLSSTSKILPTTMASMKTAVFLVVLVAVAYSIQTASAVPVIAAEDMAVAAAPSAVDAAVAPVASDLDVAEHKKKKYRGGGGSSEEGR